MNIIFDTSEQSSFQKYTTCWVFLALCNMLYLCICVFVFVYLSMKALGPRISKLILPSVSYSNTQIQIHKYTNTQIQHITKCQKDPTRGIFLKRGLFRGIKNDIHMCQTRKYKNTNTQIHKYTNTTYGTLSERPNMWYIFEKRIFQGYQKLYSYLSNAQIHKYKYTNTQIQHMMKYQKDPICGIFLKRGLFKGIKNITPMCQTCKYTNTNTQIQIRTHKYKHK